MGSRTDAIQGAEMASASREDEWLRRRLVTAFALSAAVACAGLYLAVLVSGHELGQPGPGRLNVFHVLFGRNEMPFQALQLGFSLAAILVLCLARSPRTPKWLSVRPLHVAALVLGLTFAGGHVVFHGLAHDATVKEIALVQEPQLTQL